MRSSDMELKPATGPQIVYDGEVTREDLDIWNSELEGLFARMGRLFYRTESRRHAEQYVRGLLAPIQRKNGWTIAEYVGEAEPKALQQVGQMIEAARTAGVPFAWFTADEEFGQNPGLREYLEKTGISYVMAIPKK